MCNNSLSEVIERKRVLAEAQGRVLLARRRVELIKQAYETSKTLLQEGKFDLVRCTVSDISCSCLLSLSEYQSLKVLEKSNAQREQRLSRVRQKNFKRKEAELTGELSRLHSEAMGKTAELEGARGKFVTELSRKVFPIEVESLSEKDAGEGTPSPPLLILLLLLSLSLSLFCGYFFLTLYAPCAPTFAF